MGWYIMTYKAEIKTVTAYSCPFCQNISIKNSEIDNCILKHNKEEDFRKTKDKIIKFINDKYLNVFRENLTRTNPNVALSSLQNFGKALTCTASSIGYDLKIKRLEILEITNKKANITFSGELSRKSEKQNLTKDLHEYSINKKDFDKIIKEFSYLYPLLNGKYTIYFSDFVRIIPGLKTTGGGGGEKFSYDLDFDLSSYKDIQIELEEFFTLRAKRASYINEKSRIKKEYEKERLPCVLISDIEYSVMSSDLEDLEKKKNELLETIKTLSQKINIRKNWLANQDSINIPLPDSSFSFDKERFDDISNCLPGNVRM
jgi:glutaredoxin